MKKYILIAVATLALAACDKNEDNPAASPVAAKISATIGESITSRAVDNSWNEGDQIGISSTVGTLDGPYINVLYTAVDREGNFDGTPLYFYKPMTLTAYYPYTGEETKAPGPKADGVIEANTGPENQKAENQPWIDFLWDSQSGFTASEPNVDFKFTHRMSKVTFVFQSSTEFRDDDGRLIAGPVNVKDIFNYKINGLVLDGTFNTKTGLCAVKTDVSAESLSMDVDNVMDNNAVPSVIIFPQTLSGGSATLDIYTDELGDRDHLQHYKCNLAFSDGEIKPGYHYIYTIKVSKVGLIVGKMTVEAWKAENRYMTATIDGDNPFN